MGQIIKSFGESYLEYDRGSFDEWCVYYVDNNGHRSPPHDVDYFDTLVEMSEIYSKEKVYSDYVKIYDKTGKELDEKVLSYITSVAEGYGTEKVVMDITFTTLYMAMIAEENKKNTRLGKRIKRLGIHMLLFENYSSFNAANFMKGMGWRDIDRLCKERGF